MKIAILSCFYPYRGGISQFNTCLFKELGKEHDVKAFNFTRQYPEFLFPGKTQKVSDDDSAEYVPSEAVLDSANPFSYVRTAQRISEWGPDVLIVRYWMSYFGPSLGYVCRKLKKQCKVIGILDNVVPHEKRFFDTPLTRYFLKGCDGFVTLCRAVEEDLLRLKPEAVRTVIPHPLYSHFGQKLPRTEAEDRLGLEHGKRNILFFGLIRDYKGLDILLEAFAGLDDDYRLIVAGEPYGSFDKYCELIWGMPDADKRISLNLEYIPDDEVSLYFSAADVTVLPYRTATQSGISAISYHFDVPMIVTAAGGLEETIGERGTGIVVRECSPQAVSEAIIRYFEHPEIASGCKKAILAEKERLSWKNFAAGLLTFIESIKKN